MLLLGLHFHPRQSHTPGPAQTYQSPEAELRSKHCQTSSPQRGEPTPPTAPGHSSLRFPLFSPVVLRQKSLEITPSHLFVPLLLIPRPTFTQFQRGLGKAARLLIFLPCEELSWLLGSR